MAHFHPTSNQATALAERHIQGPVYMLNLLRLREVADYSAAPHLAPKEPISGLEAYQRYLAAAAPHLDDAGGALEFYGRGGEMLIGPCDERWDIVLIVRQSSVEKFLAFSQDEEFMKISGHRTAAIEDSRLLPLTIPTA
ncbi:MAG: DUF1330 domain-containing protein [Pseudomonadota bacterium]